MNEQDKEDLINSLQTTQEFCKEVETFVSKNFYADGKTIQEWKRYFRIEIPEDINFSVLVNLSREIALKYQKAAYYRDAQQVQLAIMEQTKADKYNKEYNFARTRNEELFKKPLAAESCKIAATIAVKDLEDAISQQKVIHNFWVKTCDTLTEVRKLIELMGYALSLEIKANRDFVVKNSSET